MLMFDPIYQDLLPLGTTRVGVHLSVQKFSEAAH